MQSACSERLAKLNAGKFTSKDINEYIFLLDKIAESPINSSYDIACLFIQNAIRKYESSDKYATILRSIFEATYENCQLVATLSSDNVFKMKGLLRFSSMNYSVNNPIIRYDDRDKAISYIRSWIDENIEDKIFIIDPYFSEDDLFFVKLVQEIRPLAVITILTSKLSFNRNPNNKEVYIEAWKKISSENPPDTSIIDLLRNNALLYSNLRYLPKLNL